jgi:hypothetical protein
MSISLHAEKLLVPELNNSFLLLQKWMNFEIFVLLGYGTVSLGVWSPTYSDSMVFHLQRLRYVNP